MIICVTVGEWKWVTVGNNMCEDEDGMEYDVEVDRNIKTLTYDVMKAKIAMNIHHIAPKLIFVQVI